MRLRPCLVHGLDGSSRSKALSSQGPGAFLFRAATRDDQPLRAVRCEGIPSGELCSPATGTGVPLLSLKEDTMSIASQLNAFRPVAVLLGGPFVPQRSIELKPLVCALLRSGPRLVDPSPLPFPVDGGLTPSSSRRVHGGRAGGWGTLGCRPGGLLLVCLSLRHVGSPSCTCGRTDRRLRRAADLLP